MKTHRRFNSLLFLSSLRASFFAVIFITPLATPAWATTPPPGLLTLTPKPAPSLKLKNADGKVFDLKSTRGHWTLVHFWASWCGPCRKEMPTLKNMSTQIPELKLVLVNTSETDDEVFTFLATVSPELDSLMDRDGLVTERWKPRGLPSSYLVDPTGRLRYLALGGRDWDSPAYLNFLRARLR